MPRGYRRFVIAAFGFLILAQSEQGRAGDKQHHDNQYAAQPVTIPKLPDTPSVESAKQQCYPGSKIGVSCDGISAQAAVNQARDADKQIASLNWQVLLGVATLLAAVAAAAFARSAAHHTKRSADEAKNSVAVGRDGLRLNEITARRQLRAYVLPEDVSVIPIDTPNQEFRVKLVYTNRGQTPAIDVKCLLRIVAVEGPDPEVELPDVSLEEVIQSEMVSVLGNNCSNHNIARLSDRSSQEFVMGKVARREWAIISYGFIFYKDIFNVPCHSTFRHHLVKDGNLGEGVFSLAQIVIGEDDVEASQESLHQVPQPE